MSRDNQALDYTRTEADVIAYPGVAPEVQYHHEAEPAELQAELQENASEEGKGSSGLIRAGIVGVVLFLAVVGGVSTVNSWFGAAPKTEPVPAPAPGPVAAAAPAESDYQRLRRAWISARTMLDTEQSSKRALLEQAAAGERAIARQEKLVTEAETGLTAARRAVTETREAVAAKAAAIADLEATTPRRAVATAETAVEHATAEAERAQADLRTAKAEEARVKATVAEMRKAVKAAEAAASAADVVVGAADAAQAAVNSNQDVMADADAPTLSNLENDFFKQARDRAAAARKSADAARQAVRAAELRLDVLAEEMDDYHARFAEANQLEQEAQIALSRAHEAADKYRRELSAATAEVKSLQDRLAASQDRADKAEKLRATRQAALDTARADYAAVIAQVDRADETVKLISREFATTETALKEAQRDQSRRAALAVATTNAVLNERLRAALGDQPMGLPVFDRFVLSSEQLFDTGSAALNDSGRALLARAVPVLKDVVASLPGDVNWVLRVDGHTDSQPLSGTGRFKDNWELSQARALAVVKFLISGSDLQPAQLSANGFGEYQPINAGTSDAALAQNRRIELALAAR